MKAPSFMRLVVLLVLSAGAATPAQEFPRLQGPYLGQDPPGMTPEVFAPGIISTREEEGGSGFAREGTAFLFQRFVEGRCHTYITRLRDGVWTKPELIPFWETMAANGDFVFSSDDRTMFYQVRTGTGPSTISHVWRAQVTDTGWGEQTPLPGPVNTPHFESFASDSAGGTLYFFSRRPEGKGRFDLWRCARSGGTYAEAVNLESLNTEYDEWDPFIAPDESYLIFCSTRPGGLGRDDLYISFRDRDGTWGPPVGLGPDVNSSGSENRPWVSRDGRYFFFTSTRDGSRDTFWVKAAYLERFRR
jgi:hypothetical protein